MTAVFASARYVSARDAATLTGLSEWTLRRWCYAGKLASVKAGTRLLIPVAELEQFLNERLRPRASKSQPAARSIAS